MISDVLLAEHIVEASLLQLGVYLFADTGENYLDILLLTHLAEVGEVVDTGRIHEWNLTHADDANQWTVTEGCHHFLKFITCSEEESTVDLIYLHAFRNRIVLQVGREEIILLVQVNLILCDSSYISGLAHSLHEEQTGDDQTHLDGNGQVEDDGQEEGNQEHGNVALRILHQCQETSPTAHTIGNHNQYTCQTSHRNILGERHQEEEDEQQYHCMDDTCDRSLTAVVDIGQRAGDGTCSRNTAEEWGSDVRQTLGKQLCIRIVVVADDTVGNGSREQTLDGAEDGDGDGRRYQTLDGLPVHLRNLGCRQLVADRETVADGLDALYAGKLLEQQRHNGHQDDGDERSWNLLAESRRDGDDHHANHTDEGTPRVDGVETLEIDPPFL